MLISKKTKISKLLKANEESLETIIALSPDFKKLRNPILRRLMAGRTSIAMAAKIGGCTPEDFFEALAPLGFEVDTEAGEEDEQTENKPMPKYIEGRKPEQIIRFDVREMIEKGADPLRPIQLKVKELNPGEVLIIINSFEPVPLIQVLEKQKFQSYVRFIDDKTVETYFYKENASADDKVDFGDADAVSSSDDWDEVLKRFEGNMETVDVRHLEMPGPMMTILEKLETMSDDKGLYVYHKKVPVFLLSELKDRSYDYRIKDVQEGEVYLIIFKKK